ncbi:hypothetical protein TWF730_007460 [Orbilia blumenaviensis]|uniref:Nucleoside phosphorylase domain-containing protein n=1 Tax=Orbilia blumenaviensis TaxID=1796055 RepID=A0AAV9VEA1_9PEZI
MSKRCCEDADGEPHFSGWGSSPTDDQHLESNDYYRDPARKRLRYESESDTTPMTSFASPSRRKELSPCQYTIAWICALPVERAAAVAMLDEIHRDGHLEKHSNDDNAYTLGEISGHNIVIAGLPLGVYGTTATTVVGSQISSTFTSISFWLLVGIGGGVPSRKVDIRLGDVVVGKGVVQYDYGKTVREGRFEHKGTINKPPQALLKAIAKLQSDHLMTESRIPDILSYALESNPKMKTKFTHRGHEHDVLFKSGYDHIEFGEVCEFCEFCDREMVETRLPRAGNEPTIHYGLIASGNQVMKDGKTRDRLKKELDIICFEMEAAGLIENFPFLVIRGICDYSDSHKNKQWQEYSAATAAAYAKELLLTIPAIQASESLQQSPILTEKISERRQLAMEALKFDQIDSRQTNIKAAHAKTCQWLLTKEEYRDWLDSKQISDHHGFLWIKGKPGTGKSTIMKFALKHAERNMKDAIIISFFFNARGEDLEKSTIGMYRSLLYQLLQKVPALQSVLDSVDAPGAMINNDLWGIESLKDILRDALEKFGSYPLICFIDALDECDEDQVRDMVAFLGDLGEVAASKGVKLHICFSSRHYPHITIDKGRQFILEGQEGHDYDIARYLSSELKIGKNKQVNAIKEEILEKASGIFLWVVLVIKILNKEHDRGRPHTQLRRRLRELPIELGALFRDILTRDAENMEEVLLCIQWVLHAKRPLKLAELYFAVLSKEPSQDLGVWNPEDTTKDDMARFILSSSKGLAEVTRSANQIVQFIHESVRDFLIKENGLRQLWSEFATLNSHERLKQCCLNYMSIDLSRDLPRNEELLTAKKSEALPLRTSASTKFPFLEYAVCNVLHHADLAMGAGAPQEDFVDGFKLESWITLNNLFEKHQIRRYTTKASWLYILAERNLPNLIKIQLKRVKSLDIHGERYGFPLFAAFFAKSLSAIKALLMLSPDEQAVDSTTQYFHPELGQEIDTVLESIRTWDKKLRADQTFLFYAAEHSKWSLAERLIATGKVDISVLAAVRGGIQKWTPLRYAAEGGHSGVLKALLSNGAPPDSYAGYERTPLSFAAAKGDIAITTLLLDHGADPDCNTNHAEHRPLLRAMVNGHTELVKQLLDHGADPNCGHDNIEQQPLYHAAKDGHTDIVRQLLDRGANDRHQNTMDGLVFHAVKNGNTEVVRRFLDHGVDPNSRLSLVQTPMFCAAGNGHAGVVRLLRDHRIRKLSDNGCRTGLESTSTAGAVNGRMSIQSVLNGARCGSDVADEVHLLTPPNHQISFCYSALEGDEGLLTLLPKDGAKPDARDVRDRIPLSLAAENGHGAVVKILLEAGAELDTKCDSHGQTPLSWAAANGREAVVKILLEAGAELDTKSKSGQTPLSWAAQYGYEVVVKILLEAGAELDTKSKSGQTPLSWAAANGREAVVKILLEAGAELDTKSESDRTPLSWAAANGREAVVKILLEAGAELDTKSESDRTPLSWAAANGREAVVKILLEAGAELDTKSESDRTPLSWAAANGREAVVKILLEAGAELDSKSKSGGTPLSLAAANGCEAVVNILLEAGAELDTKSESGGTPLSLAAQYGRKAMVMFLLEKGANVNVMDGSGNTALSYAQKLQHQSIVDLLLAANVPSNSNPPTDRK